MTPPTLFRFLRRALPLFLLLAAALPELHAHALHITRVVVTLTATDEVELRIDTSLAAFLNEDAAADLSRAPAGEQTARLPAFAEAALRALTPAFTPQAGPWRLISARLPNADGDQPDTVTDAAFIWRARLSDPHTPISLQVLSRPDAQLAFPVACSVVLPNQEQARTYWLQNPGDATKPILLPAPDTLAAETAAPAAGASTSPAPSAAPASTEPQGWFSTVLQYLKLGFLHILPLGLDHILFVLSLYFLGAGWRALAAQITTFTIAHTTTLGLAAAGIIHAPSAIVEPLIALSIAFVALENIFRPRVGPGRLVAVFCFGLLHGLGFAGALSELELPRDQFLTALLSFNFGVDFGQLAILALAFLTVGWFRGKPWYRRALVIPACSLIAATGLYWTVERAFF